MLYRSSLVVFTIYRLLHNCEMEKTLQRKVKMKETVWITGRRETLVSKQGQIKACVTLSLLPQHLVIYSTLSFLRTQSHFLEQFYTNVVEMMLPATHHPDKMKVLPDAWASAWVCFRVAVRLLIYCLFHLDTHGDSLPPVAIVTATTVSLIQILCHLRTCEVAHE